VTKEYAIYVKIVIIWILMVTARLALILTVKIVAMCQAFPTMKTILIITHIIITATPLQIQHMIIIQIQIQIQIPTLHTQLMQPYNV
jgi:hypothetical protein